MGFRIKPQNNGLHVLCLHRNGAILLLFDEHSRGEMSPTPPGTPLTVSMRLPAVCLTHTNKLGFMATQHAHTLTGLTRARWEAYETNIQLYERRSFWRHPTPPSHLCCQLQVRLPPRISAQLDGGGQWADRQQGWQNGGTELQRQWSSSLYRLKEQFVL